MTSSKMLSFGKIKINFVFLSLIRIFAHRKEEAK